MPAQLATIDYETKRIQARPVYPPEPVGVSIIEPNKKPIYLAWGHPSGNNCTKAQAGRILKAMYSDYRIGTHNGKFELEVGEKYFGLPIVPKHGWEDSMLLAFLHNPREPNLKLKQLAVRYLHMNPKEEERLHNWLYEYVFTSKKGGDGEVVIGNRPKGWFKLSKSTVGGFIAYAPAELVGKYANGDTRRTEKLIKKFGRYVQQHGMTEQYEIEKRCVIKAIEMEREGVPIDYIALEPEYEKAKRKLKRAENAIQKKLGDINLNSPKQKIEAFEKKGLVDEWIIKTDKGNPSTSTEALMIACNDKQLVKQLDVYSKYTKLIGTYMKPWLFSALENNGRFHPWFNTLKGENDKGTYTGRFSSNFQQVPRRPTDKTMPFLRRFIMPDKKIHTLYNRDFSGQEIRILAHFEDGVLLAAFIQDPRLDGHAFVNDQIIITTGTDYGRPKVKGVNFLAVYGGGAPALSKNLKITYDEAVEILNAHGEALPGLEDLRGDLKQMARHDELFKTAGGRWYTFEEGKEYVALNTLIQGSAADHSKRALLNIDDMIKTKDYDARIMLTVHDEFMCSAPRRQKKKFMNDFREAMEYDDLFDLPMLTDGKIGDRWGMMEKVK